MKGDGDGSSSQERGRGEAAAGRLSGKSPKAVSTVSEGRSSGADEAKRQAGGAGVATGRPAGVDDGLH